MAVVKIGATVGVGQFPDGHPDEGKWGVQITIAAFPDQETANKMADQATPIIEGLLGHKAVLVQ